MKPLLVTVLVGAALLLPAFAGETEAEPELTPAVALYKRDLRTPIEAAGTGLAPTVRVRVTVNARGVVSDVEVLDVSPSTEYDDVFREDTIETVSAWRYAPALSDGEPVETVMNWSVEFPARSGDGDQVEQQDFSTSLEFTSPERKGSEAERRRILALPEHQRLTMLQEEARLAISFMDEDRRKRIETGRFIVFSDADQDAVAQVVGNNLEALFMTLEAMFVDAINLQPERYKIVVVIFDRRATFQSYKDATPAPGWASGFYHPAGMIALYRELPTSESLLSTLLHEGTHAFLDRHVVRPGAGFPRWIDEGFSEYIGNSRIKKKQLVPGKTQRSQIYRTPWGLMMGESEKTLTIEEVRTAIKKRKALTVSDLVDAELETFYGEKRNLYYPMSWLLIHYLRHGLDGYGPEHFNEFVLYVAEGYPAREAFRAIYGVDPASLDDEYYQYVRKF